MHFSSLPFEWSRCFVMHCYELINRFSDLSRRGKACSSQGLPPQDAKPYLYLVKSGRMRRGIEEMDVFMAL